MLNKSMLVKINLKICQFHYKFICWVICLDLVRTVHRSCKIVTITRESKPTRLLEHLLAATPATYLARIVRFYY